MALDTPHDIQEVTEPPFEDHSEKDIVRVEKELAKRLNKYIL